MEKQSPMLRLWELGEKELDFYLSFGSGLADGSAVPCINSGRYDFYDGRYERLRRPVRGGEVSENDSGHEFNYCRVYRRYRGH